MFLPDINIWVSLAHHAHPHAFVAGRWLSQRTQRERLYFCRQSQMGLLRLLGQPVVPGVAPLTQAAAWRVYDAFLEDPRVEFADEPGGLQSIFRGIAKRNLVAPKLLADDYLAAFAVAANLTLVTFDKALAARVPSAILLTP